MYSSGSPSPGFAGPCNAGMTPVDSPSPGRAGAWTGGIARTCGSPSPGFAGDSTGGIAPASGVRGSASPGPSARVTLETCAGIWCIPIRRPAPRDSPPGADSPAVPPPVLSPPAPPTTRRLASRDKSRFGSVVPISALRLGSENALAHITHESLRSTAGRRDRARDRGCRSRIRRRRLASHDGVSPRLNQTP